MIDVGYCRGRRNVYHKTALIKIDGVEDKEGGNFYHGKKIAYIYKAQGNKFRVVWGKVTRNHGSNGVVRAKFSTNLSVSTSFSCVTTHSLLHFDTTCWHLTGAVACI